MKENEAKEAVDLYKTIRNERAYLRKLAREYKRMSFDIKIIGHEAEYGYYDRDPTSVVSLTGDETRSPEAKNIVNFIVNEMIRRTKSRIKIAEGRLTQLGFEKPPE